MFVMRFELGPLIVHVYRAAICLYADNLVSRSLILQRVKEALLKSCVYTAFYEP